MSKNHKYGRNFPFLHPALDPALDPAKYIVGKGRRRLRERGEGDIIHRWGHFTVNNIRPDIIH